MLVGAEDPKVNIDEALGWQSHTSGGFDLMPFLGGHFYLHHHQQAVLRLIRQRLGTDVFASIGR